MRWIRLSLVTIVSSSLFSLPASAATLNACEQSVEYGIAAPGPDVPEPMRAFSGVWVGKMDTGLCVALIVRNIKPTGEVQLTHITGSMGGQYPVKAGNRKFGGNIVGGKLVTSGQTTTLEYSVRSANELALNITHNRLGGFQGTLKRQ
jgi:hypothetical protein